MKDKNMMKLKITIILLLLCLIFLGAFYFTAKSIITNQYSPMPAELLKSFSKTETGQKLIDHYLEQIKIWAKYRIGSYDQLNPQDMENTYFELARLIFTGFAVMLISVLCMVLLLMHCTETKTSLAPIPQKYTIFILLLIVLNGTIVRLIMASAYYGNFDMQSFDMIANIVTRGGNIYAITPRYNYSPVWFTILGFLKVQFPDASFYFVERSFLCLVDLVTLVFLLLIANHKKMSLSKTAMLFYLNPVSFLLTGYHGQFENLAILMVVIGLFAHLKLNQRPILGTVLLWFFASMGMFVKHSIFYELIICLNTAIKRYWLKVLLFAVSVCFFLVMFIPYWSTGKEGIIQNVFKYSSYSGYYGIVSLFKLPQLKYLFIIGLFVFPLFLRGIDIIRQCLLGLLFFLAFTTGVGVQYFVLPIAIGTLCPSKGFLFYSLLTSAFILGNDNNVFVPGFSLIDWNVAWLGAAYWFFSELKQGKQIVSTAAARIPEKVNKKR
jgi:hypothetical protein